MSVLGAGHVTPKSKADWSARNHGIALVAKQPDKALPLAETQICLIYVNKMKPDRTGFRPV